MDPVELEKEELLKVEKGIPGDMNGLVGIQMLADPDIGQADKHAGVLVANEGKSIYLENNLWARLQSEFRDTKEILDESSDEESPESNDPTSESYVTDIGDFMFGSANSSTGLCHLHPDPVQIFKLWQTYLNNVNPLVKILHTPTTQQLVLDASSNLDKLPRGLEALLFAIYCAAITTLDDAGCYSILGEPVAVATRKYRIAAQRALVNASWLKSSDMMVLQAFVLFILSLQNVDARITWIFTGISGRIGQRIGIHRDGSTLGLPPFEIEMRRRLWWQILMMEGIAEKLAGTSTNSFFGDALRPLNLNDSDLIPGMEEFPPEHQGATEMMFFLIRCHVGEFLKRTLPNTGFDGYWSKLSTSSVNHVCKMKAIDELEALFERKFLRYCDSSIPWHFMCIYLCKAIICMMRFTARNPDRPSAACLTQQQKDETFESCLRVIKYQNMVYTMDHMRGFRWHVNTQFQWKALIYLVSELRCRTSAPEADDSWEQVGIIYRNHPLFAQDVGKRALSIAMGNLTLKAWDAFIKARGLPQHGEPDFIVSFRAQRLKRDQSCRPTQPPQPPHTALPGVESGAYDNGIPTSGQGQPPLDPFQDAQWKQWNTDIEASLDFNPSFASMPQIPLDCEQMTWSAWDSLLSNYHTTEVPYAGPANTWSL